MAKKRELKKQVDKLIEKNYSLETEKSSLILRYQQEVKISEALKKEREELIEESIDLRIQMSHILDENIKLLQQMRKNLTDAKNDGRA